MKIQRWYCTRSVKKVSHGKIPPCWFSRVDWSDTLPDPCLLLVAQRPGCWLRRCIKAITQVAVCILKFLSFKRHTCSHLFLTRLVICLYFIPPVVPSKKKSKGKRMVYRNTKLHGSQLQSERIILRCTYMCWKSRFLRNSSSLPTRKLRWRRCCFEKWSYRWLLWAWRQLLFENSNVQETVS